MPGYTEGLVLPRALFSVPSNLSSVKNSLEMQSTGQIK